MNTNGLALESTSQAIYDLLRGWFNSPHRNIIPPNNGGGNGGEGNSIIPQIKSDTNSQILSNSKNNAVPVKIVD